MKYKETIHNEFACSAIVNNLYHITRQLTSDPEKTQKIRKKINKWHGISRLTKLTPIFFFLNYLRRTMLAKINYYYYYFFYKTQFVELKLCSHVSNCRSSILVFNLRGKCRDPNDCITRHKPRVQTFSDCLFII